MQAIVGRRLCALLVLAGRCLARVDAELDTPIKALHVALEECCDTLMRSLEQDSRPPPPYRVDSSFIGLPHLHPCFTRGDT